MGSLLDFASAKSTTRRSAGAARSAAESLVAEPLPAAEERRAAWGLSTTLVESTGRLGRKAVVHVEDLAIVCVVAEVPQVGDRIHGDIPAVVEKVRVTRDGHVRIYARPSFPSVEQRPSARKDRPLAAGQADRIASILDELRRRRTRIARAQAAPRPAEFPEGA